MTCIVGAEWDGGVVLGADSCGGHSWGAVTARVDSKLHRVQTRASSAGHTQAQELLLGFTTSFRMGQVLAYRLELPYQPQDMSDHEWLVTRLIDAVRETLGTAGWLRKKDERESAGTFLLAYRGRLYAVYDDLQVARSADGYESVGVGSQVALGALHVRLSDVSPPAHGDVAEHHVRTALDAAAHHQSAVLPPYILMHQERDDGSD